MGGESIFAGIRPTHYGLRIETNLEDGVFEGTVAIDVEVKESITSISLDARELEIPSITVYDETGKLCPVSNFEIDNERETLKISLEEPVPANSKLRLCLLFAASLKRSEGGFYITSVPSDSSDSKVIASTIMEARNARMVFPCFDNPGLKATFSVTLVGEERLTFLGNMPVKSDAEIWTKAGARRVIEFEKTPVMSTYLVAFAIGEFNMIETNSFRVPVRAYAPIEHEIENCRFALGLACKALEIFEATLNIQYPLPKLDLLAIPGATAGMENWGLVTLPSAIQCVSHDDSASERAIAINLIFHEIAHQWIGNLVTMKSWDNFWIKEGLSDWAVIYACNQMSEGSESWQNFVVDGYQTALIMDSKRLSHPLEGSISGSKSIDELFDDVTYKKGCAVLRMLSAHLGEEVFLKGLRQYLKQYAYQNTDTEDLWKVLTEVCGSDVGAIMGIWTKEAGYPFISLTEDESSGTISITQNRFLLTGYSTMDENEILFPILLKIRHGGVTLEEELVGKNKIIKVPSEFYKINADQTGFYRVAYPPDRLLKLGESISTGKKLLSAEDRAGIISDTAALVFSCYPFLKASDLLSLLQNFENETSYFVWKTILSTLRELSQYLASEDCDATVAIARFQKQLVKKCLNTVLNLAENDNINEQRFKALMFGNPGNDDNLIESACSMFDRFIQGDTNDISPTLRREIFKITMKKGDSDAVSLLS
jgi:aminopeptidase 2